MAGNKGAVAIRLDYNNTSLCFVTAHLAAGFANYDERNRDYETINHGLKFQRNRSIDDHDAVIWLGDFNYRIGLSDDRARSLIRARDFETLYENDQVRNLIQLNSYGLTNSLKLNLQMVAGLAFRYYSEARIMFPPTYKYDNGTDNYDTSEKVRIPAWTDRVLRKGKNLRQTSYNAAPLRFSDHRPVYATFQCEISIVDEAARDKLSHMLYNQRRKKGSIAINRPHPLDQDDSELVGYQSIAPGLPPASSDHKKWWLDSSLPVKSTTQPPTSQHILNPARSDNPFVPSREPDWIQGSQVSQIQNIGSDRRASATSQQAPPPPPPRRGTSTTSNLSSSVSPFSEEQRPALPSRKNSVPLPTREKEKSKGPPPVPRKPASLSSPTLSSRSGSFSGANKVQPSSVKVLPSSGSTGRLDFIAQNQNDQPGQVRRKVLPSSHNSTGLLDGEDDEMDNMSSWKPILPR
jgi:endonuclease/exonuclease/phosphatase family metal-dependent hydrolase